MITVKLMGGLGNQMFQYAYYLKMKQSNEVKFDTTYFSSKNARPYMLSIFPNIDINININSTIINKYLDFFQRIISHLLIKTKIYKLNNIFYREKSAKFDSGMLNIHKGFAYGYFQKHQYFDDIKDLIFNDFKFDVKDTCILKFSEKIKQDSNSVSIHIRRGDYINDKRLDGICTLEYYQKAIDLIKSKLNNDDILFYVFSDDIEWVKANLQIDNAIYVTKTITKNEYFDWYDMYLMSCCKHNILANSSFSFWSAYLNRNESKMVIIPRKWVNDPNDINEGCCDDWIKI